MPKVFVRAIRPRKKPFPPKPNAALKVLDDAMEKEVKPIILEFFNKIVAEWKNKPEFRARKFVSPSEIRLDVFPVGEHADIWRYVSQGTRPHIIRPRGTGYPLRFNWGGRGSYKPRTTTSGGYKGPGRVIDGKEVRFAQVSHPGTKARNFEKHIARWTKPKVTRIMNNAMRRAKRKL